jgi:hypothetical protein
MVPGSRSRPTGRQSWPVHREVSTSGVAANLTVDATGVLVPRLEEKCDKGGPESKSDVREIKRPKLLARSRDEWAGGGAVRE